MLFKYRTLLHAPDRPDADPERDARDLDAFFRQVAWAKRRLHIRPGPGTEGDRRRIALVVAEAWLLTVGTIESGRAHQAATIETQVYANAHGLHCDPLPIEDRVAADSHLRAVRWDPLKRFPLAGDPRPETLVQRALDILNRTQEPETADERDESESPSRVLAPGRPRRGARGLEVRRLSLGPRPRPAGDPHRVALAVSRTLGRGLVEGPRTGGPGPSRTRRVATV